MYRWKSLSASFELPSFRVRHQFTPHLRERQHEGSRTHYLYLLGQFKRSKESGDAVSFLCMPIRAFDLQSRDGTDELHSTRECCFAILPFTECALVLAALAHTRAVKLANRKVLRYVLDDLLFDPAPKAFQRTSAVWHIDESILAEPQRRVVALGQTVAERVTFARSPVPGLSVPQPGQKRVPCGPKR